MKFYINQWFCHIVDELKGLGVDGIYVIVGHKAEEVMKLC